MSLGFQQKLLPLLHPGERDLGPYICRLLLRAACTSFLLSTVSGHGLSDPSGPRPPSDVLEAAFFQVSLHCSVQLERPVPEANGVAALSPGNLQVKKRIKGLRKHSCLFAPAAWLRFITCLNAVLRRHFRHVLDLMVCSGTMTGDENILCRHVQVEDCGEYEHV